MKDAMPNRLEYGSTGSLGRVQVVKRLAVDAGSCNFCSDREAEHVHELTGERTAVRLCGKCLEVIQNYNPRD